MKLAALQRAAGRPIDALAAVEGALRADPLDFTALLLRASLLEGTGQPAGQAYGNALQRLPSHPLSAPLAAAVARARNAHDEFVAAQRLSIAATADAAIARAAQDVRAQLERFVSNSIGRTRHFAPEPTHYAYPGLPALEFHPRDAFPWLDAFEAATPALATEAVTALQAQAGSLEPYIQYADGLPLRQWTELNRSDRWSALHLIREGLPTPALTALPRAAALLASAPQPALPARSPSAMISVLAPRTRIPAHHGVTNVRLVVHVPLMVPPGCAFRVGATTRAWMPGQAFVFDDTVEHEAWNDSDQPRAVLIFDIWHPALSAAERDAIAAVFAGIDGGFEL